MSTTITINYGLSLILYFLINIIITQIYVIEDSLENKELLNNYYYHRIESIENDFNSLKTYLIILSIFSTFIFLYSFTYISYHAFGILSSLMFYM